LKPILETTRIALRLLTPDDCDELVALDSDPAVTRHFSHLPTPDDIRTRILPGIIADYERYPGFGFYAAIDRGAGEFVGWFHLRPYRGDPSQGEIGYRLRAPFWGRGIATEVSLALIERAFGELGVTRVVAETIPANAASIRVMEKLGMRRAGTLKQGAVVVYEIARDRWRPVPR